MNQVPSEEVEQYTLVKYLEVLKETHRVKYTAIPNSTYTKSWKVKVRNKRLGLNPGLPDLFIIIDHKPLFIEMKRTKGGVVSKYQKSWIEELNKSGIPTFVAKGYKEARDIITQIIENPDSFYTHEKPKTINR